MTKPVEIDKPIVIGKPVKVSHKKWVAAIETELVNTRHLNKKIRQWAIILTSIDHQIEYANNLYKEDILSKESLDRLLTNLEKRKDFYTVRYTSCIEDKTGSKELLDALVIERE